MSELSPAARSVFESFNSKFDWVEDGVPGPQFSAIAAALRALDSRLGHEVLGVRCVDCSQIELIAAELESLPDV